MVSLIKKDFVAQKGMLAGMAGYMLLSMLIFGEGLLISSMGAVAFVLMLTGCERDDRNNTDLLWNSLPTPRWQIVAAKYFSTLAYALLAVPAYWLISLLLRSTLAIDPITAADVVSGLVAVMALAAITLPVFFAFGYRITIFYLGVLALLGFGALFFLVPQELAPLARFLQWRQTVSPGNALALLGAFGFCAMFVSFLVATGAYTAREFT